MYEPLFLFKTSHTFQKVWSLTSNYYYLMGCFVSDNYFLKSIIDRAILKASQSVLFHPASTPSKTGPAPSGFSYCIPKKANDLSLCDSLDRCEADVNPCQIKSYCGVCFPHVRQKGWERALSRCSPWGCVCSRLQNCAHWLVCGAEESWPERGLSLSEVTRCYNSHTVHVGRRAASPLQPRFSPQLTFWPINHPWTRSRRNASHWKFRVYQGFDITRAGRTRGPHLSYEKLSLGILSNASAFKCILYNKSLLAKM